MTENFTPQLADFKPGGKLSGDKINMCGYSIEKISEIVAEMGEKPFRAKQIFQWLYIRGGTSISDMTDLPNAFREKLDAVFTVDRPAPITHQISKDGTQKWLIRFYDGNEAEMVYIPEDDRGTLCISSQVGCTLTCKFCHTGTQMLVRNLVVNEIVGQVLLAKDTLNDWNKGNEKRRLTNVVFMGMGEPLFNTDNVIGALGQLSNPNGLAISRRKVTISTSGVVPDIERLGNETGATLAVSLHAPNDKTRTEIMPINNKYNLEKLMDICRRYPDLSNTFRITWEYVMLKGVNDSDKDAKDLVRLIKGIPSKVNLIPFNPWEGSIYECSDKDRIRAFSQILYENDIPAPIRKTRGEDIMAACGQLKSESERQRKNGKPSCAK